MASWVFTIDANILEHKYQAREVFSTLEQQDREKV